MQAVILFNNSTAFWTQIPDENGMDQTMIAERAGTTSRKAIFKLMATLPSSSHPNRKCLKLNNGSYSIYCLDLSGGKTAVVC